MKSYYVGFVYSTSCSESCDQLGAMNAIRSHSRRVALSGRDRRTRWPPMDLALERRESRRLDDVDCRALARFRRTLAETQSGRQVRGADRLGRRSTAHLLSRPRRRWTPRDPDLRRGVRRTAHGAIVPQLPLEAAVQMGRAQVAAARQPRYAARQRPALSRP